MKPFVRINLSSVLSSGLSSVALAKEEALAKGDALRMGIFVSSLVLAMWNASVATKKGKE